MHKPTKRIKRLKKFRPFKSIKTTFNSAIRKANKKRAASSLEVKIYSWLDELGIKYKKEKAIGRCHVDIFLEPDIILELEGCYWHGCSKCFPVLNKMQKAAKVRDGRRYSFFKKKEYKLIIIKECEVKSSPERVKTLLRKLLDVYQ